MESSILGLISDVSLDVSSDSSNVSNTSIFLTNSDSNGLLVMDSSSMISESSKVVELGLSALTILVFNFNLEFILDLSTQLLFFCKKPFSFNKFLICSIL